MAHVLNWGNIGYIDVYGVMTTNNTVMWLNRVDCHNSAGNTSYSGHHAGNSIKVLASNLEGYSTVMLIARKGIIRINSLGWLGDNVICSSAGFCNADNVYGDIGSLSDARLKTDVTPIEGPQALDVLSRIQGCTYEREDLGQRRVGLIADEVETAIEVLACDNIVSSKFYNDDQYKTLDYGRLVALLIPAVTHLSKQVKDLESKSNGTASKPSRNKSTNGSIKHN